MRVRNLPLFRAATFSLILCAPSILTSCTQGAGSRTTDPGPRLPDALPLPDEPERLIYLDTPQRYLDEIAALGGSSLFDREMIAAVLGESIGDESLAEAIARSMDWSRPLAIVQLDTRETIASIPLRPDVDPALQPAIDALSRKGSFGARALSTANDEPAAPRLLWRNGDELAVATSLRGLATAGALRQRYGDVPIQISLGGLGEDARVQRVQATGSVDAIDIRLQIKEMDGLLSSVSARGGALTSLANHDEISLGGSFAWTGADAWIRGTVAQISDTISEQPFLIRSLAEKIGRRANAVLRTWDGRCFVGFSARDEFLFGLGSNDPKKSGVAMLRLFGGIAEDLAMLRNFFDEAPSVSLRKNVGDAAGEPIHRLSIGNIRSQVPSNLRGFLDERGRITLHFAFSRHTGAGMFVVGSEGLATLRGWLKHSADAPGQEAYTDDLASVRTSVPILSLQDVERNEALDRLFALPTMTRARSVTVSMDGPDALLVRYRTSDTGSDASHVRQAKLSTLRVGDAPPGSPLRRSAQGDDEGVENDAATPARGGFMGPSKL